MPQNQPTRRRFVAGSSVVLAQFLAGAGNPELLSVGKDGCLGPLPPLPVPSLKSAAGSAGLYFGTAVKDSLLTQPAYQRLILSECNTLVCEYHMKMDALQADRGVFTFSEADRYVAFAAKRGFRMRGHTLIWHEALPNWLSDLDGHETAAALEAHVGGVVSHYAGRVHSWDVVNEPTSGRSQRPDSLRESPWLAQLGEDYIHLAMQAAHRADKAAQLVINFNPSLYRNERLALHYQNILQLLERLLAKNTPIHAVGFQSHLDAMRTPQLAAEEISGFFEALKGLGLPLILTELDCNDQGFGSSTETRDAAVLAAYQGFLDIALSAPTLEGVLCWGLSDRQSGLNQWPRNDGLHVRALPFDVCLNAKPLRGVLLKAFERAAVFRAEKGNKNG